MNHPALTALLQNAALVLVMVVLFDLLTSRQRLAGKPMREILVGLVLGGLGIGLIAASFRLESGIVFDTRSVLLSVSALFLGPIPTVVALAMTAAFRLWMGGAAAWPGVAVILTSCGLGLAWRHYRRRPLADVSWGELYLFGLVVHVVMLALMLALPWETARRVLAGISLPVLLIYPPATAALGLLLANRLRRERDALALAESEARFRLMVEAMPMAILVTRLPAYEVEYVNSKAAELFRFRAADAVGQPTLSFYANPDDAQQVRAQLERTGLVESGEILLQRAGGGCFWAVISSTVATDARGRITLTAIRDITERKLAEEALHRSERNYREIFNATNEAIFLDDAETGCLLDVNDAMLRMYGYDSKAEVLAGNVGDLSANEPPYTQEEALRRIRRAIEEGPQVFEWLARRKNGERFWVEVSLRGSEIGGQGRVLAVVRDITERKRVAHELERRELYFRSLIENASDLITVVNRDGVIRFLSPASERILGYPSETMTGRDVFEIVHPDDVAEARAALARVLTDPATRAPHELRLRQADGQWRVFQAVGRRLPGEDGEELIVVNSRDLTEHRKLEEQLRHAQKMEAIGQLAGGVAHDFNNILAVILLQAELITLTGDLPARTREGVGQIRAAAERAAILTRQLLLFSRRQVMQPRKLDLNEIVTNLTKMLRRLIGADVQLQLNLHPTPLMTVADPGMLDQVLMNLAVNARDAMPNGGRLVIETSEHLVDDRVARLHPEAAPGRYVCLSVSDTGCGIPPEIRSRIFEPFFTTKEAGKGTGLGLATVFGIVKQHRGWISVYSEPGRGTTFRVFFPVRAESAMETAWSAAVPSARGGTETILVVEDEPAVRALTTEILEGHGYRVLTAASGEAALALWRDHRDRVALVVTDLVMPGSVSGPQLTRRLQADRPGLKVLYVSGYSAEIASQEPPLRTGVNYVQKPFSPNQLLETVRRCLDG